MTRAYISLGSNLGDRAGYLLLGVRGMMEAGFGVRRLSSMYETDPIGVSNHPLFLNMVAEIEAGIFSPEQVLARLLRVEYMLGRRRDGTLAPRTIDLDLLLYGAQTRDTELLQLPHPRMHLRRFVLAPLAELAPGLMHPTLLETVSALLTRLDDNSKVRRVKI